MENSSLTVIFFQHFKNTVPLLLAFYFCWEVLYMCLIYSLQVIILFLGWFKIFSLSLVSRNVSEAFSWSFSLYLSYLSFFSTFQVVGCLLILWHSQPLCLLIFLNIYSVLSFLLFFGSQIICYLFSPCTCLLNYFLHFSSFIFSFSHSIWVVFLQTYILLYLLFSST